MSVADIFERFGEPHFREGERRVISRLLAGPPVVLATGGGAYADAETRRAIREAGAVAVWLRCALPVLLPRGIHYLEGWNEEVASGAHGRVAAHLADHDLGLVVHSPLVRTAETAAPTLARHGLTAVVDPRVIEAGNRFEGRRFRKRLLLDPRRWWWMRDPTKPTWGEPYRAIARRMTAAIEDARDHARGREVLIVSHQLPIWTIRSVLEQRNLWHDPRKRECNLASLTSVTFTGDEITDVTYSEPAAHLYAQAATIPGA